MNVDLIDLVSRYKDEKKEINKCINKVLKKGHLILTEEVSNFENAICKYTNSKFCLGLNSGTDALMMALWSCGIGKGDEVITTAKSFIATIAAIVHVGAKPVLVDINEDLNINTNLIEEKITKNTKAILPVHWTGRICNMEHIIKIAKKNNLIIIEDAAQAMGSYYKNKHAGSFSKVACYSAHPLKNLNALGDAGYLTTNDENIYKKIKLYRNHGLRARDDVEIFGVNSRLDTIHAEILSMRLLKLKKIIKKRRENIEIYRNLLKNVNEVSIPNDSKDEFSSYVMFITQCQKRDDLQKYLQKFNVQSLVYYGTPLHLQEASKKLGFKKGDYPKAEQYCEKVLALPHHQYLNKKQIEFVSGKIIDFYHKN
jgi:dTDP-4-amino-4,6-dideoxygalactose transaminase